MNGTPSRSSEVKKLRYSACGGIICGYAVLIAGLLATSSAVSGQAAPPIGDEFEVNTYSTGTQTRPAVAVAPDGSFVVVWDSYGSSDTDSSSWSVQAQRFAADGSKLGDELQVNTYTTGRQEAGSVAINADGSFVVVWQTGGSSGTDPLYSVQGQRFAADGTKMGSEFQVNSYTTGRQSYPAAAALAGDEFVVVWQSYPSRTINGQRFGADGSTLGDEFQVDTSNYYGPKESDVAAAGSFGDFVVTFSAFPLAAYPVVLAQRFAADGSILGGKFVVTPFVTAVGPAVSASPTGDFVIVWKTAIGPYSSIRGRPFNWDETPVGDFVVNPVSPNLIYDTLYRTPKVAMAPEGEFVVVWAEGRNAANPPDGSETAVEGLVFSFDLFNLTSRFTINTYSTGNQNWPDVAMDATGRFVVVWRDEKDSADSEIRGRRFESPSTLPRSPIFSDGFESGDVLAWSAAVW